MMRNEKEFALAYVDLVARAWHDKGFLEWLRTDPRAVLAASGLPLEDDAVVTVVTTRSLDIVGQVDLWRRASSTGRYVLQLPLSCVEDLSDEQLESIVGGAMVTLWKLGFLTLSPEFAPMDEP
jgi:hypothetical protein